MTSRIAGESVNTMTRRSMPMPSPAVGGMPTRNGGAGESVMGCTKLSRELCDGFFSIPPLITLYYDSTGTKGAIKGLDKCNNCIACYYRHINPHLSPGH